MTSKRAVDDFLAQRRIAVVGVSRDGRGFGYAAWKALRDKGYDAEPVNPQASTIDGRPCYRSLRDLPEPVGAALVVTPPASTAQVVEDAISAGIRNIWLQQGAVSQDAVRQCAEHGIEPVAGECILMFADPGGMHKFHRWVWNILGKLPQ
jgi:predicted CoA-binding protein